MALARIHHRLDRECHSLLELEPGAWLAVVQNLRIFVINTPDAMAAVFAYHGIIPLFHEGLDRVGNVPQAGAGVDGLDPTPHRFETGLRQALGMSGWLANEIHPARVAVEAVTDDSHIDVDDVACFE